jgi:hypothetical protein
MRDLGCLMIPLARRKFPGHRIGAKETKTCFFPEVFNSEINSEYSRIQNIPVKLNMVSTNIYAHAWNCHNQINYILNPYHWWVNIAIRIKI